MKEKDKIKLGRLILRKSDSLCLTAIGNDEKSINIVDFVLNKISEIEKKVEIRFRCKCNELFVQDLGRVCGSCYEIACPSCIDKDFYVCLTCVDAGKAKEIVNDKNGKPFWTGRTLRNENTLTSEIKILQIHETHIVYQTTGFWRSHIIEIKDFIAAGWIVHEKVTEFETNGPHNNYSTKCKFIEDEEIFIGSLWCTRHCGDCRGSHDRQKWVICELYNKEPEK